MAKKKQKIPFLFRLLLSLLVVVILIFAVDYIAQKNNIHNSTTESVHEAKENISRITQDVLNQVLPEKEDKPEAEEAPVSSGPKAVSFPQNLELPVCKASPSGLAKDHQIRKFANYSVCYRESYEQAEWAAYCLEKEELVKNATRGNNFRADPEIITGSATPADYKKSGYDRGHLAPAADFSFSEEAMSESFFMSNMSPQAPGLNREIWQYLEGQVREWAASYGKVYVVTGPVLEKPAENYESIGENQVSVPEFYYKVLLSPSGNSAKALGFIIPNRKCEETFWDFAVSVDEVEKRTGLDFFSLLEDTVEDEIEKSKDISLWR